MAWNPSPEVADARELARKWKKNQIVIFAIADGQVQMTTYGETRQLCDDAKQMGEYLWDYLMKP